MAVKKRWETAARNPLAERLLSQRDGSGEVLLERLEADLTDASRYEIVAALKELEKAGRGQFIVGRKGQKSRFVWTVEKPVQPKAQAKPVVAREVSDEAAPSLSTEPGPKGSTRKALVPAGRGLERPKLSTRERPEPLARELSRRPARVPSTSLQHSFHLRPGVLVSIELPEDVTTTEIERFCGFLKSIPFAGSPRG